MTYALETRAEKKTRQMLEAIENEVLIKTVDKININRISSQQIRET